VSVEMTPEENKVTGKGKGLLEQLSKAYKKGSSPASWIFGTGFVVFLICVFFLVPKPSPTQCGIIRMFMALAAGLFTFFLVGGVVLQGQLKGLAIGAGGGAAVFVLMQFVFNPVPGCVRVATIGHVWDGGQQLGELVDTLRRQRAAGVDDIPRIEFSPEDEDRVTHFNPHLPKVSGDSWGEVFKRISDSTDGCLVCEISNDGKVIKLAARGTWTKTASDANPNKYEYACR
jgi:hypothetical protein